jgi:hypothetical protein
MKMIRLVATMAFLCAAASAAHAQSRAMGTFGGFFTPYVGASAGGEITQPRMTFGGSVSVQEQDGWGAEVDFAHTPDTEAGRQVLDLTTYMVNASWIQPVGSIRPFVVAGGGVMQINGCDAPCNRAATTYDFGWSAGGGVLALLNDTIGVRGDVRYFFSSADHVDLRRPDNFSFWRVAIGATLMWAILP